VNDFTRAKSYHIGGERDLPFIKTSFGEISRPLIALEICDDREHWPPVVLEAIGDIAQDVAGWTTAVEKKYGADLVRLYLTSTKRKNFADFSQLRHTIEEILEAIGLPLIIEGSNEPSIDSEVFQACGEAGEGERLLLGTAEAGRYRSVAAAALAYNHSVIAQSPIDINLAKQLNILLHEIGVPHDHIVIEVHGQFLQISEKGIENLFSF
jgi:acetyl-CoA decarbonylase/synthase complex subunit delta